MKPSRAGDFFIGFLGSGFLDAAVFAMVKASPVAQPASFLVTLLLLHAAVIVPAAALKRPWIALGSITAGLLPALVFGACFVLVATMWG